MPSNKKKIRSVARAHRSNRKNEEKIYTIDELVKAADQAIDNGALENGCALYQAALTKLSSQGAETNAEESTKNTELLIEILEKLGEIKVSLEDQEGALMDYRHALERLVATEQNSSSPSCDCLEHKAGLHFYIGQLCEGKDGLDAYRQGIEYLQKSLEEREKHPGDDEDRMDGQDDSEKQTDPTTLLQNTRKQLSAGFCSVAELYLTDLCYEDNAEHECETYIQQALNLTDAADGEPLVDALQTAANLRLSQSRGMEAVDYILRAFEKIRVGCEALASLVGLHDTQNPEQATELLEMVAVRNLPGFEFRCQMAKILLECAAVLKGDESNNEEKENRCVNSSINVLGSLLAENDEVIEIWFLLGDAFAAMNPPNVETASHYWERTKEMLTTVQDSLELEEPANESEENDIQQQLDEIVSPPPLLAASYSLHINPYTVCLFLFVFAGVSIRGCNS